jgi:ATP/maltotriose-dependent transcriptional regulator MalT
MTIFIRPSSSATPRATAISPTGSARNPRAGAEIGDTLTLWVLGRIDEALRLADRALADAELAAHAPTMGYVLVFAARLALFRYNSEAVATYSRALADIVSRYDLPAIWAGAAVFFQGWAKRSDDAEESRITEMRRGLAIFREQGRNWLLPIFEAALAKAEASAGETDAGLRRLDDALAELGATEARWYEAEMHRVRGEILRVTAGNGTENSCAYGRRGSFHLIAACNSTAPVFRVGDPRASLTHEIILWTPTPARKLLHRYIGGSISPLFR